jgi:hypothetical protein
MFNGLDLAELELSAHNQIQEHKNKLKEAYQPQSLVIDVLTTENIKVEEREENNEEEEKVSGPVRPSQKLPKSKKPTKPRAPAPEGPVPRYREGGYEDQSANVEDDDDDENDENWVDEPEEGQTGSTDDDTSDSLSDTSENSTAENLVATPPTLELNCQGCASAISGIWYKCFQ